MKDKSTLVILVFFAIVVSIIFGVELGKQIQRETIKPLYPKDAAVTDKVGVAGYTYSCACWLHGADSIEELSSAYQVPKRVLRQLIKEETCK